MDCLFCKIIDKKIPSDIVYEDEKVLAFKDVNPQAPVHVLVIPKDHIPSTDYLNNSHKELIGHILLVAKELSKELGLDNGYRIINNCNEDGGQTVAHIHFHILGGRQLMWPPG